MHLARLLYFFVQVCLIIPICLHQIEFHYEMWNHCHISMWGYTEKLVFVDIFSNSLWMDASLGLFQIYQKILKRIAKKIGPFFIKDPNTLPTRIFSALWFSNMNTLLTTQHRCFLPYCLSCMIRHILITKDRPYVCRTNDAHLFPSFSHSLCSELWPIFGKASSLYFPPWSKEKMIHLRVGV